MLSCIALALPGCALMKRKVELRYVSVYCLSHDQFEQLKAQQPPKVRAHLNGQAEHDAKILAGSAVRLRAYSDGLLEILGGCTQPDATKLADRLLNESK